MKSLMIVAMFAAGVAGAAAPAMAQTSVGIRVGQPNFYGRIDLGGAAPPPVYFVQPVIVERQAGYLGPPIYLRVPVGHRLHWHRYCRAYHACGQQVYFVQDGWYNTTYAPHYRQQYFRQQHFHEPHFDQQYRPGRGREFHHGHGEGRGHGHGDGHGQGHGQGHGRHGD
jgi:hypothetical protein